MKFAIPRSFGTLLQGRRLAKGIPQDLLAKRVQLSREHLSKVENNKRRNLRLKTLLRLATELNLSLDALFLRGQVMDTPDGGSDELPKNKRTRRSPTRASAR
jgi:transcriptional regulator with XRE-family HTH domain